MCEFTALNKKGCYQDVKTAVTTAVLFVKNQAFVFIAEKECCLGCLFRLSPMVLATNNFLILNLEFLWLRAMCRALVVRIHKFKIKLDFYLFDSSNALH